MPVAPVDGVPMVKQPQGFENAGKPGYYTVKPGDTLTRIALENGQSPRDIAAWSKVENPNRIEVGQVLRVVAAGEPGGGGSGGDQTRGQCWQPDAASIVSKLNCAC